MSYIFCQLCHSVIDAVYDPVLCGPNRKCEYSNKCLAEAAGFVDCKGMDQPEQEEVDPTLPGDDPFIGTSVPVDVVTTPVSVCKVQMSAADRDRNNMMSKQEYIFFVNRLRLNAFQKYTSFDELPEALIDNFDLHAMGGEIDILGASPATTTTEAQLLSLENFCATTDKAISFALSTIASMTVVPSTTLPDITAVLPDGLGDLDLESFSIDIAGTIINVETAMKLCPNEYERAIRCVIQECPNFMDTCSDVVVEPSNLSSCEALNRYLCNSFLGQSDTCCLEDCVKELYSLVSCVIVQTIGEDQSVCSLPDCPFSIPDNEVPELPTAPTPGSADATDIVAIASTANPASPFGSCETETNLVSACFENSCARCEYQVTGKLLFKKIISGHIFYSKLKRLSCCNGIKQHRQCQRIQHFI